jgi:hypothetical protein
MNGIADKRLARQYFLEPGLPQRVAPGAVHRPVPTMLQKSANLSSFLQRLTEQNGSMNF